MNLTDGSISSYCYILNPAEHLDMINQSNELAAVTSDIESDSIGSKENNNKIMIEVYGQRKNKAKQNKMMKDDKTSKCLHTWKFLVCQVFVFGMDHINNLKVKYFRVIILYRFRSEKLKGRSNKVELVEDSSDFYTVLDLFQPKTDLFPTRALIRVHFKTVH